MSESDVLWLKFTDDTGLPAHFSAQQKDALMRIFDPHNPQSHWSKALRLLGLKVQPPDGPIVSWVDGVPYMHWNYMTAIVSSGSVRLVREDDNGFGMRPRYAPLSLLRLLATHWRVSNYLNASLHDSSAETDDERIIESLALGICLLIVRQRLPNMDEETLAKHLQSPEELSYTQQKSVQYMNEIQERRTAISSSWQTYFSDSDSGDSENSVPAFYWNTPECTPVHTTKAEAAKDRWKGIGVSGSTVSGRVIFAQSAKKLPPIEKGDSPVIVVFPQARPDTVDVFEHVDAVLYGTGGVMAHACVIAREYNMPCITALGPDFIEVMRDIASNQDKIWLNADIQSGEVTIIER